MGWGSKVRWSFNVCGRLHLLIFLFFWLIFWVYYSHFFCNCFMLGLQTLICPNLRIFSRQLCLILILEVQLKSQVDVLQVRDQRKFIWWIIISFLKHLFSCLLYVLGSFLWVWLLVYVFGLFSDTLICSFASFCFLKYSFNFPLQTSLFVSSKLIITTSILLNLPSFIHLISIEKR